jgi:carboxylesterase
MLKILRLVTILILLFIGWVFVRPLKLKKLTAKSRPVNDYAAALERIEALQALDTYDVNPVCRLRLLTHGQKTERVLVFWHGFTSCPRQFFQLGQMFYQLGYNVLIPRLPHHGLTDRLRPDQRQLTAEDLIALVDGVLDLAHGLGQQVTVAGFSAGGVLAGWAAQYRPDIAQAVIISPAFGLKVVPLPLAKPAAKLLLTWPNVFRWWDPRFKAETPGPPHAYPRYSTRALGQILRLGLAVRTAARQSKPAVPSILVVTNPHDWAVNNDLTAEITRCWCNNGSGQVRTYAFEVALELGHDLIDPAQVAQRINVVYPILMDLIDNRPSVNSNCI